MTHAILTFIAMPIAPLAVLTLLYWSIGRVSTTIENRRTIQRRIGTIGRKRD